MDEGKDPGLLFVYGTLKRGFPNPWSRRLWAHAAFLGEASMPGRLVDLGAYPALLEPVSPGDFVHGEVAALRDASLLGALDLYEGPQYKRIVRRVRMYDGSEREAWVYLFRASPGRARIIPGGRWPVK
jgi:gamma-glutamylcyclotransferase (GGCT)/AIG2-like uncharacterized protein YtfP